VGCRLGNAGALVDKQREKDQSPSGRKSSLNFRKTSRGPLVGKKKTSVKGTERSAQWPANLNNTKRGKGENTPGALGLQKKKRHREILLRGNRTNEKGIRGLVLKVKKVVAGEELVKKRRTARDRSGATQNPKIARERLRYGNFERKGDLTCHGGKSLSHKI